jgi:dUTPase
MHALKPCPLEAFKPETLRNPGGGAPVEYWSGVPGDLVRRKPGSACWDLWGTAMRVPAEQQDTAESVLGPVAIEPGETKTIQLGLRLRLPRGPMGAYHAKLHCRSSLAQQGMELGGGIIDHDYCGEVCLIARNVGPKRLVLQRDQAVAQLELFLSPDFGVRRSPLGLESFCAHPQFASRGEAGFGSSDKRPREGPEPAPAGPPGLRRELSVAPITSETARLAARLAAGRKVMPDLLRILAQEEDDDNENYGDEEAEVAKAK